MDVITEYSLHLCCRDTITTISQINVSNIGWTRGILYYEGLHFNFCGLSFHVSMLFVVYEGQKYWKTPIKQIH